MNSLLELLEAEDKLVKNIRFAKASYEDFKDISYSIARDYKEIAEYLDNLQKLVDQKERS